MPLAHHRGRLCQHRSADWARRRRGRASEIVPLHPPPPAASQPPPQCTGNSTASSSTAVERIAKARLPRGAGALHAVDEDIGGKPLIGTRKDPAEVGPARCVACLVVACSPLQHVPLASKSGP